MKTQLKLGIIISSLTVQTRMQAAHAVEREARTQALYRLTRELTGGHREFEAARIGREITREVFGVKVIVFLPDG